jgi:hypothetical protein
MSVHLYWFFFNCIRYLLRHTLDDDNKMDCIEVGCEGLDLFSLTVARDTWCALVNTIMNPFTYGMS